MIAVVIPYYQRDAGILRKALASIASQQPAGMPVHVIVVDDASPIAADAEIAAVPDAPYSLQLVRQANAGPGAARNKALDHVPEGTRYVAFLDSDDEWSSDHLQRAVLVLEAGFDFYFADLVQLGATTGAFERGGRINLQDYPSLAGLPDGLHRYTGDLLDQTIRGNLIGTPTVVYRFDAYRKNRFRVEFANAGEDYLFWMDIATSGARVAFSSRCEARCGKGVNVYAGSGWGTEQHLLRIHNEMKYRKLTGQLFRLNVVQQRHIDGCVRDLRLAFARDLLHRIGHSKPVPWAVLRQHLQLDPRSFFELPINLSKSFFGRRA
jgi:succinoglycan biosynthesis protein ExoW